MLFKRHRREPSLIHDNGRLAKHLTGLRDSRDAHVDAGNGIPCGKVGDAGYGQGKYLLEDADRLRRAGTVDAVGNNGGDGGIIAGNPVELLLELAHFVAGGAYG